MVNEIMSQNVLLAVTNNLCHTSRLFHCLLFVLSCDWLVIKFDEYLCGSVSLYKDNRTLITMWSISEVLGTPSRRVHWPSSGVYFN